MDGNGCIYTNSQITGGANAKNWTKGSGVTAYDSNYRGISEVFPSICLLIIVPFQF